MIEKTANFYKRTSQYLSDAIANYILCVTIPFPVLAIKIYQPNKMAYVPRRYPVPGRCPVVFL